MRVDALGEDRATTLRIANLDLRDADMTPRTEAQVLHVADVEPPHEERRERVLRDPRGDTTRGRGARVDEHAAGDGAAEDGADADHLHAAKEHVERATSHQYASPIPNARAIGIPKSVSGGLSNDELDRYCRPGMR